MTNVIINTVIFFWLSFITPIVVFAQEKQKDVSMEEIEDVYNSLPKENGKIQLHEVIKFDSIYTKMVLNENAKFYFSRLFKNGHDVTFTDEKMEGKFSGRGTFGLDGGSTSTILGYVSETRDVDFNIEISFRDGQYAYNIYDVLSLKRRRYRDDSYGQSEDELITLEQAYKLCKKSSSVRIERRLFYQTIEKLMEIIELLKLTMARSPLSKDLR